MNILYCGDQGIARGVLVSILSLLMNGQKHYDAAKGQIINHQSPEPPTYHIYIMTINYPGIRPFKAETAHFLDQLVKGKIKGLSEAVIAGANPQSSVTLLDATAAFQQNPPTKNMGTYFTPCAMLRLYADQIPELAKLPRLLYLDYDVVARQDISPFYHTDLKSTEAAGVLDLYGRHWYHYHGFLPTSADRKQTKANGFPHPILKQDYMNSGVMLFNLPECQKSKIFQKAINLCAKRKMLLPDQAALNKAITRRRLMPRKYNEQAERPHQDTVLHHFSNNFKFWPYFRVQKVKPFETTKIHKILKIHEYDDILKEYNALKGNL